MSGRMLLTERETTDSVSCSTPRPLPPSPVFTQDISGEWPVFEAIFHTQTTIQSATSAARKVTIYLSQNLEPQIVLMLQIMEHDPCSTIL